MSKEKKISIYVRNSKITPSSYYRIAQYVKDLDGDIFIRDIAPEKLYIRSLKINSKAKHLYIINGIPYYLILLVRTFYFFLLDILRRPDYIVVSKLILPKYMPFFVAKMLNFITNRSILFWDYDDLIFNENYSNQVKILGNNSKKIITTSNYLKDKLQDKWKSKTLLIPTTDGDLKVRSFADLKDVNRKREETFKSEIKLIWVASNSSMPYLENILETLDVAAEKVYSAHKKKLLLTIVCNARVKRQFTHLEVDNIEWSREGAIQQILESHIGIMPLQQSSFSLGKGGFKLIQYMAAGLPCIASSVGYNKEIISVDEGFIFDDSESQIGWIDSILELSANWERWNCYSYNSFVKWEKSFSYESNLKKWKDLLSL